jgi:hypothetical protein
VDLEALELETDGEQFDDVGLVVDDEDASFRCGLGSGSRSHVVIFPSTWLNASFAIIV